MLPRKGATSLICGRLKPSVHHWTGGFFFGIYQINRCGGRNLAELTNRKSKRKGDHCSWLKVDDAAALKAEAR